MYIHRSHGHSQTQMGCIQYTQDNIEKGLPSHLRRKCMQTLGAYCMENASVNMWVSDVMEVFPLAAGIVYDGIPCSQLW